MPGEQPSHLRAAIRLALAGIQRGRAPTPVAPVGPGRKLAVERRGIRVDSARVRRYLEATRGSDLYGTEQSHAALPATYSAVWETALTLELLAMEGLPLPSAGLIHLRSELVAVRVMRLGDRFRCRVELERVDRHARGTRLLLKCRSWNSAGQLCQENATEILVLSREGKRAGAVSPAREARGEAAGEDPELAWAPQAEWELLASAGLRYARASGDFNPVHLWPWTSRLVGYSRPILHGHCSMAMVAHELARPWAERGSRSLRMMAAAFRAPLALPARVRLMVASEPGDEAARFRLEDADQEGGRPYVEGKFVG